MAVGPLLKRWRTTRRRSQLDLSLASGISQRHLSCVETGRSQPSRGLVLRLAEHLDVPLRERNVLLGEAGFAPAFRETAFEAEEMAPVREAIEALLEHHTPHPAVLIDVHWNVVRSNGPALALMGSLLPAGSPLLAPPWNLMRLCFHPDGLRPATVNFDEAAPMLLGRLLRDAARAPEDEALQALAQEVSLLAGVDAAVLPEEAPPLVAEVHFVRGGLDVKLFSVLATLGAPRDIALDGLTVELFYPRDAASAASLARLAQHG